MVHIISIRIFPRENWFRMKLGMPARRRERRARGFSNRWEYIAVQSASVRRYSGCCPVSQAVPTASSRLADVPPRVAIPSSGPLSSRYARRPTTPNMEARRWQGGVEFHQAAQAVLFSTRIAIPRTVGAGQYCNITANTPLNIVPMQS